MKKIKIWSMILLTVMMLPIMVACTSDDDGEGGGIISYTEAEIVEMLKGQWAIKGEISIENPIGGKNKADYSGTITFSVKNDRHFVSDLSPVTLFKDDQKKVALKRLIVVGSTSSSDDYKILRKESKTYIRFRSYYGNGGYVTFQILSLSKNSFKLVLDEIINDDEWNLGHVHMTMISQ